MKKRLFSVLIPAVITVGVFVTARPANAQYVQRRGSDLRVNGKKVRLFGGTLYPTVWQEQYLGGDAYANSDAAAIKKLDDYLAAELNRAKASGFTCVRIVNFLRSPSDYSNATAWNHVDKLIDTAASKQIYCILDLSTFRDGLVKAGKDPYAPKAWSGFVKFAASRYKNRSNLAMYSIAGEIPAPNYNDGKNPSASKLLTFFDNVSTQIRKVDKNHLISSGGFIYMDDPNSGIPWQQIFSLPHIGLATIHAYGRSSSGNEVVPVAAYKRVGEWANRKNIPFLVEEFGAPQSMGDPKRSAFFGQQYTLCAKYTAAAQIFWNFGLEVISGSFDVNASTPQTLNTVKKWAK